MMKHYFIYLPGLGDTLTLRIQKLPILLWPFLLHVKAEMFDIAWVETGGLELRLRELNKRIQVLTKAGYTVSLIGSSAGASTAVIAYAKNKERVHGLVTICGALGPYESVGEAVYALNPRFETAMRQLQDVKSSLTEADTSRMLTVSAKKDRLIATEHTKLCGAKQAVLPITGHVRGVTFGITLGIWKIKRYLTKLPRKTVV